MTICCWKQKRSETGILPSLRTDKKSELKQIGSFFWIFNTLIKLQLILKLFLQMNAQIESLLPEEGEDVETDVKTNTFILSQICLWP